MCDAVFGSRVGCAGLCGGVGAAGEQEECGQGKQRFQHVESFGKGVAGANVL